MCILHLHLHHVHWIYEIGCILTKGENAFMDDVYMTGVPSDIKIELKTNELTIIPEKFKELLFRKKFQSYNYFSESI